MTWQHWLKGLLAAFVSGAANAVSMMIVDPEHFNFGQFGNLGEVALISGLIGAAMYLKQSPVPDFEKQQIGTTQKSIEGK